MIPDFSIARLPRIEFGSGAIRKLPAFASHYGQHVLLITGKSSYDQAPYREALEKSFSDAKIVLSHSHVDGEPSPQLVDRIVHHYADADIDCVVGLGGGSAMDAAKAIAGLLRVQQSVLDFLEGVGPEMPYPGPAVPLILVPTTAGTGSEATKNGVLSVQSKEGYKKSFRDDQLVPEWALVDPDLLASCPPSVIAANGMDALTQLLESFVSTRHNQIARALCRDGLAAARDGLLPLFDSGGSDASARNNMAYAALISGIALAQTGLGSVHGLASPLGAFFPIPHGVVCGTLVAKATELNIQVMREREPENPALGAYAEAASILCDQDFNSLDAAHKALINTLKAWTMALKLPRLAEYGVSEDDIDLIVHNSRGSSMKTNPIVLSDGEIAELIRARL